MSYLARLLDRSRPRLLDAESAYARWVGTYSPFAHNALMKVEQETIEAFLIEIEPRRALDVGTGTGRYLRVLLDAGVPVVLGVDRSAAMLSRARETSPGLVRADARALPIVSGAFDLVVSSLMAGDLEDLAAFASEASRVLAPGGSLLYSDFHPSWAEHDWERTFRDERGRRWRLPYHPHRLDHHKRALEAAGLELTARRELLLPDLDSPVLVVVRGRKR